MATHQIPVLPETFARVVTGESKHVVVAVDRKVTKGDVLVLHADGHTIRVIAATNPDAAPWLVNQAYVQVRCESEVAS